MAPKGYYSSKGSLGHRKKDDEAPPEVSTNKAFPLQNLSFQWPGKHTSGCLFWQ